MWDLPSHEGRVLVILGGILGLIHVGNWGGNSAEEINGLGSVSGGLNPRGWGLLVIPNP